MAGDRALGARPLTLPPGPRRRVFAPLIGPGKDPLGFLTSLARTYGDVASFRLGSERACLVSHPDRIRDVLVTHNRQFTKSRGLERARKLLGNGLLTSEGATHLAHRRLLQPAFHHEQVAGYASAMTECADRTRRRWTDGQTLDLSQDMMRLTLAIVGRTLFGVDIDSRADVVGVAVTDVLRSFWISLLPLSDLLEHLPFGPPRRARAARARLDKVIYDLIAERRRSGEPRADLLSILLRARDEERVGLSDRQVRDEAMTLLLAGHETTANALAWTWYLLAQTPDAEARLHDEIDRVLAGRLPTVGDLGMLEWTEKVALESMRLYPPAWVIGRRAMEAYGIDGYQLPPRAIVLMSQYVVHRDPRFYEEPERFRPERWTPPFKAQLPAFAYFPFGGGPRQCIGESFARMELVLVLATLAQQCTFRLTPGHHVEPQPMITLRARHGIRATVHTRGVS